MTTTKTTLKRILCVISCCLVVVFSFAVPASAVIDSSHITFEFAVPNPADNFDGYVIVPSTDENAVLLAWDIYPMAHNTQGSFNVDDVQVNLTIEEKKLSLFFFTQEDNSYYVTVYYIYDGLANGIERVTTSFIDFTNSETVGLNTNGSYICPNYSKGITRLYHDDYDAYNPANSFTYDCIFSANHTEIDELKEINDHFFSMLQKMDLSNEQLAEVVLKLNDIYDTCVSIDGSLGDFVYYYWEDFVYYTLPEQFNAVCTRLDTIIRLLNKKGDVEQTTVDSSNVDNYLDIEQSLVHNDEAESALNDLEVDINGAGYAFIWDFITELFNTHPEVFGLVITILTLGIIALILNR